jgi:hypothetical protein
MADYDKATNFTGKDTLTTGDPGKLIKGSELDAEFLAIEGAMDSKANIDSQVFTGTPTLPAGTIATTVADNTDSSTKIATTAFVQSVKTLVLQSVFPVGAIYTSYSVSTDPATVLGFGTWSAIEGKVLTGYQSGDSDFGTAGGTGGSKDAVVVSHTHTTDTQGSHRHTQSTGRVGAVPGDPYIIGYMNTSTAGGFNGTASMTTDYQGSHSHTVNSSGVSGTGKNLQPYVTVHMWRRTA